MLEVLLTVIPSLCWMVFRCYQLLHTPAERLARQLNVDIPHTPSVCVDQLSATQLVLHWDIEILADENIFYVVLVNGKDAGTLAQTSVKLCNLEPDSLYRIQILAVNAISNFRSQSPAVYVHTLARLESRKDSQSLPFSVAREVELPSSFHESPSTNYSLDLSASDVVNVKDRAVLAEYLYVFQNELSRVTADIDALFDHQRQEEIRLKNELDAFKKELEEGSDVRAKKDLDVKDLEKKKDLLTFEKLKLAKQLRNYETARNIHVSKLADLRAKVAKLREKRQHVVNTSNAEKSKVDTKMDEIFDEISTNKETIASLEQRVKELNVERKDIAHLVLSLRPLVEQFITPPTIPVADGSEAPSASAEIFTRENTLTKLGAEVLGKIYAYEPDWKLDVERELDAIEALENSWKSTFRAAIRKFLGVQHSVEAFRASQDKAYEPQKMTEYQASVEFGGFGNAIGKPPIRKKGYVFVDEGSASPSPSPEANDTWNKSYSQFYDDSGELSPPPAPAANALSAAMNSAALNSVNSVNSGSISNSTVANDFGREIYQPMHHQYTESTGAIYGDAQEPVNFSESQFQNQLPANQFVGSYGGNFADKNYGDTYGDANFNNFRYPETNYEKSYEHYQEQPNAYDQANAFERANAFEQTNAYEQTTAYEQQFENSYDNAYVDPPYTENAYENAAYENSSLHGTALGDGTYSLLAQPMANSGSSGNYLHNDLDQGIQLSIPQSSMQQYAQNIRQSFPYDDMYGMRSPTPESYRQSVQPNLWNNTSQSNFLDSRRTFLGLSLLPASVNMELHSLHGQNTMGANMGSNVGNNMGATIGSTMGTNMGANIGPNIGSNIGTTIGNQTASSQLIQPQIQVPQVNHDNLFNSLLLSSNSSQIPSSSIWLDRPMSTSYSHNRAVSSTSQLWRTDPARAEGSPSLGLRSDFLPFSPKKEKDDRINTSN